MDNLEEIMPNGENKRIWILGMNLRYSCHAML